MDWLPAMVTGFPVAHVFHLAALVERWGVTRERLLAGSVGLEEAMADPRARVPVRAMVALLERARSLAREPALGMYIGLDARPTLYGNLGFALMSAANVFEALELAIRFSPTVTTALHLQLQVEGPAASLVVEERATFGAARDTILIAALLSLHTVGTLLAAPHATTSVAELALPEPAYAGRLAAAGLPIRFGCPAHRLVFDVRSLEVPFTMASPTALRLARDHCQRDLERTVPTARWTDAVRLELSRADRACGALAEVASALHQSQRTLRRRLAEEGSSFTALRDEELRERATRLVGSSRGSVRAVASQLGFSDPANFARAFRRWTSTTPSAFRRAARAGDPASDGGAG